MLPSPGKVPLKLIFSRKGFDSQNGRVPSPILPDCRMRSLPIPDGWSAIRYSDIAWDEYNLGQIVEDLTGKKVVGHNTAHLDPDLDPAALPRKKGWQGLFGPGGRPQTHLDNNGVSEGDLFLFFGWFRETCWVDGRLTFVREAPHIHVLFGWLQIGSIREISSFTAAERQWAEYHPHFFPKRGGAGTILTASKTA